MAINTSNDNICHEDSQLLDDINRACVKTLTDVSFLSQRKASQKILDWLFFEQALFDKMLEQEVDLLLSVLEEELKQKQLLS